MAGYIKKNNEFIPLTGDGYGLPLGTIIAYEGSVPDGFLACDGSAYNITTYSALYALLGVGTTPDLTSQKMTNTDGWCIKATPAYVEPDTVSDMVHTMRVQDSYSLEEVNTGKTWIDGKPIYKRTYNGDPTPLSIIGTLNAFEDWNIPIPTNADTLIKSELRGFNSVSKYYSFFFASASICFNNATGKLTMFSGSNSGTVKQATIWYTKSTD